MRPSAIIHAVSPAAGYSRYRTQDGSARRLIGGRRAAASAAVAVAAFFFLVNPYAKPPLTLLLATVVFALGLYPLWRWMGREGREDIPVLEIHGFFYAICFGLAGFVEPIITSLALDVGERELQWALVMTLLGLASLYLAYFFVAPRWAPNAPAQFWPFVLQEPAHGGLVLFLYLVFFSINWIVLKVEINVLSQMTGAVTTFFFILLLHAYLSGRLGQVARLTFQWLILPANLVLFSGLMDSQIAGFVTFCVWIGIIYMATRNKIPFRWIMLGVLVFFLLQPVKGEFRSLVWERAVPMSPAERFATFGGMGLDYYFGERSFSERQREGAERTFQRINHLHLTAAIMADTSDRDAYLYGESYLPLFTKWIPRFLWPDKPIEDLGNRWARQYGYLGQLDYVTSFNLPWLPEMYMNFGVAGVIVVNFLLGLLFRLLSGMFWRHADDSSAFAFGLSLGAPLMFVESHLSMKLGGLVIVVVTLFVLMAALTVFLPKSVVWRRRPATGE